MSPSGTRAVGLEIGCGPRPGFDVGTAARWVGIDADLAALREAQPAVDGGLACADARRLPLRNGACHKLVLQAVLHHLLPVEFALAELSRVAAPGATVTIVDGTALEPADAERMNRELHAAGLPAEPIAGFDLDRLRVQLADVGLEVQQIESAGTATFATPPFVSQTYSSDRFRLTAIKREPGRATPGPLGTAPTPR